MIDPIQFPSEESSNRSRKTIAEQEPKSLRTFTPTQAVLSKSAGVYHWTPEGRKLFDFSSGVLVANLGHNPTMWMKRFCEYMGWHSVDWNSTERFFQAVTLTSYNAVTEIEAQAVSRLLKNLQSCDGGSRCESVLWAASGSEAVQKALWAALHFRKDKDIILATRQGFHGKKGLAGAVTGSETDSDRDPRVKFLGFPREEIDDLSKVDEEMDLSKYRGELETIHAQFGSRLNCLITEPYLGGGGSYHPPAAYLQLLESFCRENDVLLVLDEIQSNFGRTGKMYAFEKYGIEPDLVCLGKGMGNGVPVSAVVGRKDVLESLNYGEGSDTWSANPLACAAVLATLDEFENNEILKHAQSISEIFIEGLSSLKESPLISKVRGEGMVFGVECASYAKLSSEEVANAIVRECYLGAKSEANTATVGIHLLGPLAGNVLRISPPLVMTQEQAGESLALMRSCSDRLQQSSQS